MKYRTIVADPPWDYSDTSFREGAGHGQKYSNKPLPYAVMTLADIAALPVRDLAAEDALLFLWTTSRYLPDSFQVVEAWGFRYVQMLVWVKPGPMPLAMPFAPPATEFLLGCKRGKPSRKGAFPSSAVTVPQGRHSEKPEAFIDYIESVGEPPYLELFARRQRLGWHTWGNECFVSDGLPLPEASS
jgi:N6-adenosine-specific RNA methylase IME4